MSIEHRFGIAPAHHDADISKCHGCILSMGVFGGKGGVEFNLHTGWYTGDDSNYFFNRIIKADDVEPISEKVNAVNSMLPRSLGVTIHSHKPLKFNSGGHKHKDCPITGGDCWTFINYTEGYKLQKILIEKGHRAVFDRILKMYREDIPE